MKGYDLERSRGDHDKHAKAVRKQKLRGIRNYEW